MKRCFLGVLIISSFIFSAATSISGDILGSFPAKTNMIVRMYLEKLRGNSIYASMKEKNIEAYNSACEKFCQETGIKLEEIKTIWVAGIGKQNGFIVFEGNFNPEKIKEIVSKKPELEIETRGDCELALLCPNRRHNNGKSLVALVNSSTIVAGTPEITDEFIKNFSSGVPTQNFSQKDLISGDKLIEGSIMAIPQDVAAEKPFLAQIDSGHFDLDINGKIAMTLVLKMTGVEQADALCKIMEGMVAFGKLMKKDGQEENPLKKEILDNMSIENSSSTITVKTSLSETTLNSEIEKKNCK